jgi:hypothetical protein
MNNQTNLGKLQDAGMIIKTPLPEPYADVINSLSGDEVDVLVSVKQRLDEAGGNAKPPLEHFATFIVI